MNVVADKLFHGHVVVLISMTIVTYVVIFAVSCMGYFPKEVSARKGMTNLLHVRRATNIRKGRS